MDESLKERIDLLLDTNQISNEIYSNLPLVVKNVEDFLNVNLSEENAGSFVSHLCVALQRIAGGIPVTEMSEELKLIIQKYPEYFEFAKQLLTATNNKGINVEAEAGFITLYFGLLAEEENMKC